MRFFLLGVLVLLCLIWNSCHSNVGMLLRGKLDSKQTGVVKLAILDDRGLEYIDMDSTVIVEGKFQFDTILDEPRPAILIVKYDRSQTSGLDLVGTQYVTPSFWTANSEIDVEIKTIGGVKILVSGSDIEDDAREFGRFWDPSRLLYSYSHQLLSTISDSSDLKYVDSLHTKIREKYFDQIEEHVDQNSDSYYSLFGIYQARLRLNQEQLGILVKKLSFDVNKYPVGRNLNNYLSTISKLGIGKRFPLELELLNFDGKPIQLNFSNSRYTLIELWATWCVPCRKIRPELHGIYLEKKLNGFNVVSISIDDNKSNWLKTILDEKYQWDDFIASSSSVIIERLGITGVPRSYLLDSSGIVVYVDIGIPQLKTFLKKL